MIPTAKPSHSSNSRCQHSHVAYDLLPCLYASSHVILTAAQGVGPSGSPAQVGIVRLSTPAPGGRQHPCGLPLAPCPGGSPPCQDPSPSFLNGRCCGLWVTAAPGHVLLLCLQDASTQASLGSGGSEASSTPSPPRWPPSRTQGSAEPACQTREGRRKHFPPPVCQLMSLLEIQ